MQPVPLTPPLCLGVAGSALRAAMPKDDDSADSDKQNEQNIEIWKIKKLLKSLEAARG